MGGLRPLVVPGAILHYNRYSSKAVHIIEEHVCDLPVLRGRRLPLATEPEPTEQQVL